MTAVLPDSVLPGDVGAEMTAKAVMEAQAKASARPQTALERLVASRERIRAAMMPEVRRRLEAEAHPAASPLLARLRALPGVSIVVDSVSAWWSSHPLRPATMVGAEVSRAIAKPMAQKHPYGLVVAGLAIGAALALARPWRWLLKPALFAGLVPQLASKVVSNLPLDSWMNMLNSILATPRSVEPEATAPSVDPGTGAAVDRSYES